MVMDLIVIWKADQCAHEDGQQLGYECLADLINHLGRDVRWGRGRRREYENNRIRNALAIGTGDYPGDRWLRRGMVHQQECRCHEQDALVVVSVHGISRGSIPEAVTHLPAIRGWIQGGVVEAATVHP